MTHYHYLTIEQRERLQAIMQARLAELGAGLARLHTPDYGVCEKCGGDIPSPEEIMELIQAETACE